MKNNFLDQFYTIDEVTGDYIIEIALKNYDDIFNSWDSSVYNIRDLDSSLKSFLEDCSNDISRSNRIKLRFNIEHQDPDSAMEDNIKKGIKNYFRYRLFVIQNQFIMRRKRTIIYILVALLFTVFSFYFTDNSKTGVLHEVVLLSLTVGGWVFLWEAFSLFFIQRSELYRKRKQYKRIIEAPIYFKYK